MSNYIDRQTAIDALGERPMTWTNSGYELGCVNQYDLDRLAIETVSTANVQPVVRCKDCKHRHLDGMIWNCPFGLSGGEGFFCAYGAKDGEQNETD